MVKIIYPFQYFQPSYLELRGAERPRQVVLTDGIGGEGEWWTVRALKSKNTRFPETSQKLKNYFIFPDYIWHP